MLPLQQIHLDQVVVGEIGLLDRKLHAVHCRRTRHPVEGELAHDDGVVLMMP